MCLLSKLLAVNNNMTYISLSDSNITVNDDNISDDRFENVY